MKKLLVALCLSGSWAFGSQIVNPATSGGGINSGSAGQFAYYAANSTNTLSALTSVTTTQVSAGPNLFAYKRPSLFWISNSSITITTGTVDGQAAGEVIFPDGQLRTDSTSSHLIISTMNAAAFVSGTAKAGLLPGESGTQGKYSVFAVKSQINSSDFVVVLDSTPMIPPNYSLFNSIYGTNGYIYIGTAAHYDNQAASSYFLRFRQSGNHTVFENLLVGSAINPLRGILLATSASASTLTYTYATGPGATQFPPNISIVDAVAAVGSVTSGNEAQFKDSVNGEFYGVAQGSGAGRMTISATGGADPQFGFNVTGNSYTGAIDITVTGWYDDALGVGSNPMF